MGLVGGLEAAAEALRGAALKLAMRPKTAGIAAQALAVNVLLAAAADLVAFPLHEGCGSGGGWEGGESGAEEDASALVLGLDGCSSSSSSSASLSAWSTACGVIGSGGGGAWVRTEMLADMLSAAAVAALSVAVIARCEHIR